MLNVGRATVKNCQGKTRRELLQVAGVGAIGLTLADWLRCRETHAASKPNDDVSCIFLWLDGGPSHFETFDPKPDTSDGIRGPYGAIPTNVPGIHISELLPMTARRMDKCVLLRSLNHSSGGHSAIPMLSGLDGERTALGAVVTKFKGFRGNMPPYVHLGSALAVGGGRLGAAYEPLKIPDPSGKKVQLPGFTLNANITPERFLDRRQLLGSIDEVRARFDANANVQKQDQFHRRAVDILTSTRVQQAFDLSHEEDHLRERYGANFFGQSCVLARRLVEAGTRFVQIKWYDGPAWDAWDVHGADLGGMVRMEHHLCPRLDQGLSTLLDDLDERGMLDSTIVVAVGEFGRTPKINKFGARDHWPHCFSALLAGGGLPRGAVVGASDKTGSRPEQRPVSPAEFASTLYYHLGIDTTTVASDPRIRPFTGGAAPVAELIA
jgi:hypothetical protein